MKFNDLKKEIPRIFEKVRKDVRKTYRRHRAGLSLGLVEMGIIRGGFIGAMHFAPGTDIVMNTTPLKLILESQPDNIVRAYVYHILLHEYIHSLGVLDESACRQITLNITEQLLPEDHPAVVLARKGIGTYIPDLNLIYAPPEMKPDGISIEYIEGFDKESYNYYS